MTELAALGALPSSPAARAALPGPATIPAHVRAEGPQAVESYRAALGFERMLLVQLLENVNPGTGEDDGEGDAAGGAYRDLVPQTLADTLAARGGVGLADELYRSLRVEDG